MKKITSVLDKIFTFLWTYGALITVLLGGISSIAYLVAIIIGGGDGGLGEAITVFLHKSFFKYIIYTSTVLVVLGWLRMEIREEKALTASNEDNK